jgi:hypothetical protein
MDSIAGQLAHRSGMAVFKPSDVPAYYTQMGSSGQPEPQPNLGMSTQDSSKSYQELSQNTAEANNDFDSISWLRGAGSQTNNGQQAAPHAVGQSNQQGQQNQQNQQGQQVEQPMPSFKVSDFNIFDDVVTRDSLHSTVHDLVKSGSVNFFKGVDDATVQALSGGDMTKLAPVLNVVIANAVGEALTGSISVLGSRMPELLSKTFKDFTDFDKTSKVSRAVTVKDPFETAVKQQLTTQYLAAYPNADVSEVKMNVESAYRMYQAKLVKAGTVVKTDTRTAMTNMDIDNLFK